MMPQLHITADKRLRYAPPKLPSATSFIRRTLCDNGMREDIKTMRGYRCMTGF